MPKTLKYYLFHTKNLYCCCYPTSRHNLRHIILDDLKSTLNLLPSKTEFMLIGHPQKISKITNLSLSLPPNPPITPTHSDRYFGFIFDANLTYSKQISSLSTTWNYHIRDLHRIRHTLDRKTTYKKLPLPSLLLLLTPHLIFVTLFISTYLKTDFSSPATAKPSRLCHNWNS